MKKVFTLLAITLFPLVSFAQEEEQEDYFPVEEHDDAFINYQDRNPFTILDTPQVQIGLHLATTPFITQLSYGGGMDVRVRYTNNLSAGLMLTVTGRNVKPTFGYLIGESRLMYYDINIYNELAVLKNNGFELAARLSTGFAAFNLADNTLKEPYYWYDEYGFRYEGEKPVTIANNYFFKLAPSLVMRYKVGYNIAIEGSLGYNFFMGNASFGNRKDFNNFQLQLGIKIDL